MFFSCISTYYLKGALTLGLGVGNASNCRCNSVDLHDVIERWQMEIEIFVCPSLRSVDVDEEKSRRDVRRRRRKQEQEQEQ